MVFNYNMNETMDVAERASTEIEKYLRTLECTIDVINVEGEPTYQVRDIDMIWVFIDRHGNERKMTIEVKGDRWEKTGNYFFETISNKTKGTPGCFLYTEADYIYYYFINTRELHRIPVEKTRNWFLQKMDEFKEKETSTPVGNGRYYITVGRLVPKSIVQKAIPEIKIRNLRDIVE